MNTLKKIALHSAVWVLAFCAVLISPIILIYGVPLVVGAVSDVVHHAGDGAIVAFLIAVAMACVMSHKAAASASDA